MKPTAEEIKEMFITERTRIISEMLDNPDEFEIYPTTKCFNALDKLFGELLEAYAEAVTKDMYPKEFVEWLKGTECRYWFNPILHKWGLYSKFIEFEEVYQYWKENIQ